MSINYNDVFGTFLPNIYIKNIVIEDTKVNIIFSIKESIDLSSDSNVFSVSSDDFLKEHLSIKVTQFIKYNNNVENKPEEQELPQFDIVEEKNVGIRQDNPKIFFDSLNNREMIFNISFYVNIPNIKNLLYVFETSLVGINEKFGIDSSYLSNISRKTNELIFKNGNIQDKLYNYYTLDDQMWPGEINTTFQDGKRVFFTNETPARLLKESIISNIKLRDFRNSQMSLMNMSLKISDVLTNLDSQVDNTQLSLASSFFNKKFLENINDKKPIFENYAHIYDSDRRVTYLFSINFKNLIQQKCMYKNIINNNNLQKIIDFCSIMRCDLYRKQIVNKNSVSNSVNTREIASKIGDDFKQISILPLNSNFSKTYIISDPEASNIFEGLYEYHVEIEFMDGVVLYLKNLLDNLLSVKNNLLQYANICQNPRYYNSDLDSFVSEELRYYYGVFNISNVVNIYSNTISQLNDYDQETSNRLNTEIEKYLSPFSANLKTINIFIQMYNKLLSNLLKISSTSPISGQEKTSTAGSENNRIFIKKVFKEKIDLSVKNQIILEYFKTSKATLNLTNFEKTINEEKNVFELNNQTEYPDELNYSFISPSSIVINNVSNFLKLNNEYIMSDKCSELMTEAKLINAKKDKILLNLTNNFSNQSAQTSKINNFLNILNVISEQGVIIDNEMIPKENNTINSLQSFEEHVRSQDLDYDCIESLTKITNISKLQDFSIEIPSNAPNQIKYSKTLDNLDFNEDINILKYRLLMKIEILESIIEGSNSEPIWSWQQLTLSKLRQKINSGLSNILIRLIPHNYEYNDSFIYKNINFKFNNHFILNIR